MLGVYDKAGLEDLIMLLISLQEIPTSTGVLNTTIDN
jgi:hypothetical protein